LSCASTTNRLIPQHIPGSEPRPKRLLKNHKLPGETRDEDEEMKIGTTYENLVIVQISVTASFVSRPNQPPDSGLHDEKTRNKDSQRIKTLMRA
jgi:hypothetical protein